MRRKLTSVVVELLNAPGPKRMDVWDTVLQGFGVRGAPEGQKAWLVAVVRPEGFQDPAAAKKAIVTRAHAGDGDWRLSH